jgi:ubiquitin carboxyl-terminal hydrolase 4/11/15
LIDTIHEDLNRVKVKPYIESTDSNGRSDEIVSAEHWDGFIK